MSGPNKGGDEASPQAKDNGASLPKALPGAGSPKKSDKDASIVDFSGTRQMSEPKKGSKGFIPPHFNE